MKLTPVNGRVLVEVSKEAEQTASGFMIGRSEGGRTESVAIKANVVALASDIKDGWKDTDTGIKRAPLAIAIGDTIFVSKWEGQKINFEGKEYISIKPEFVEAKVNE